mmetsp:Transcript_55439/g.133697  ORF Transcript_55439/g.133697 Transcript_55439/m.133697 type:complete len:203 (-) Transcript_55439:273-881(-)
MHLQRVRLLLLIVREFTRQPDQRPVEPAHDIIWGICLGTLHGNAGHEHSRRFLVERSAHVGHICRVVVPRTTQRRHTHAPTTRRVLIGRAELDLVLFARGQRVIVRVDDLKVKGERRRRHEPAHRPGVRAALAKFLLRDRGGHFLQRGTRPDRAAHLELARRQALDVGRKSHLEVAAVRLGSVVGVRAKHAAERLFEHRLTE